MLAEMTASAGADPFEDGLDAFNAADYAQAYAIWWPLAKEGDAKAQASVRFMYYSGKGVRRDDEQSLYWFRRAADAGQPTAQFFLGMQYFYGRGVPRDLAQAYSWCDIALSNGYSAKSLLPRRGRVEDDLRRSAPGCGAYGRVFPHPRISQLIQFRGFALQTLVPSSSAAQ